MTERGIRFHTPDVTTDVGSDEAAALREEPKKIAATNPPRPDIATLLENLTLHERALGPEPRRFEPSEGRPPSCSVRPITCATSDTAASSCGSATASEAGAAGSAAAFNTSATCMP
jgi:hypothetical protein